MEPRKPQASKLSKKTETITTTSASTSTTSYVVQVVGDKNPFTGAAHTLSRSAWNRFRVYIQLLNAFPGSDVRRGIIIELIRDLLLTVVLYRQVWKRLSPDHRYLMVTYVRHLPFL